MCWLGYRVFVDIRQHIAQIESLTQCPPDLEPTTFPKRLLPRRLLFRCSYTVKRRCFQSLCPTPYRVLKLRLWEEYSGCVLTSHKVLFLVFEFGNADRVYKKEGLCVTLSNVIKREILTLHKVTPTPVVPVTCVQITNHIHVPCKHCFFEVFQIVIRG